MYSEKQKHAATPTSAAASRTRDGSGAGFDQSISEKNDVDYTRLAEAAMEGVARGQWNQAAAEDLQVADRG